MSENKCQFHVGEEVWILPFDDAQKYIRGSGEVMFGIDKQRWNHMSSRSPFTITEVHSYGASEWVTLRGDCYDYGWPWWALSYDQYTATPVVEDLL